MADHEHPTKGSPSQGSFLTSRAGMALVAFLVIVGFLLTTEHRAHTLGALLWLLILACPLLHMFMHGGHGSHSGHNDPSTDGQSRRPHTKETTHEH